MQVKRALIGVIGGTNQEASNHHDKVDDWHAADIDDGRDLHS
jgi:hypothetical protein